LTLYDVVEEVFGRVDEGVVGAAVVGDDRGATGDVLGALLGLMSRGYVIAVGMKYLELAASDGVLDPLVR